MLFCEGLSSQFSGIKSILKDKSYKEGKGKEQEKMEHYVFWSHFN